LLPARRDLILEIAHDGWLPSDTVDQHALGAGCGRRDQEIVFVGTMAASGLNSLRSKRARDRRC
jgi:hypothetical protein